MLEELGYSGVKTLLNSGDAAILRKAGTTVTTRNWATVLKLEALLEVEREPQS